MLASHLVELEEEEDKNKIGKNWKTKEEKKNT